jgi:HAD superfamily hydrolase (TIGR01459 family)
VSVQAPSPLAPAARWVGGLSEWLDSGARVDGWVVDQFGVLHDGRQAYPGAADALRRLVARGDPVIVLSNSGKRNAPNRERLAARGFGPDCVTTLLTSGELTHQLLAERHDPYFAALGARCWLVSNDGDTGVLDGLPIERVDSAARADFLVFAGVAGAHDLDVFDADLCAAAARRLPAICANPDLQRLDGGDLVPSSGALALRYEALGGAVRWIGKPHPDVYAACRRVLAAAGRHAPAMIGDSLLHDVAGAQAAGWASVLVAGGLHREALRRPASARAAAQAALQALVRTHGLARPPDVVIDALAW